MRVCLKCRAFYDDDNVKFCLNDGDPLLNIDQSHDLWEKGTEAIRETRRTASQQIRRKKLTRVVSITVTAILTVMVVSLAALNSYIYLNPEEKEVAQAIQPLDPQATPGIEETPLLAPDAAASPTPSKTIETPSPIMTARTPRPSLTPTTQEGAAPPLPLPPASAETPTGRPVNGPGPNQPPALEPTATINLRDVSPPARAPSPIPAFTTNIRGSQLPSLPPTSKKTPASSGCSVKDKLSIEETLKNRFASEWEKEIAQSGEDIVLRKQFSWQKFVAFRNTSAALRLPADISVRPSKDCKKADVKIKYTWRIESPKKQKEYGGVYSYECSNKGDDWSCQKESQRLFCISEV